MNKVTIAGTLILTLCLISPLHAEDSESGQEVETVEQAQQKLDRLTGIERKIERLKEIAADLESKGKTEQAARLREKIAAAEKKLAERLPIASAGNLDRYLEQLLSHGSLAQRIRSSLERLTGLPLPFAQSIPLPHAILENVYRDLRHCLESGNPFLNGH